jgi:BMFP domain-containing protein YqiC
LRRCRGIAIVSDRTTALAQRLLSTGIRQRAMEALMVQTTNRFFDEAARLMNDAAGVAQGVRREFETLFRGQAERILRDLDIVQREEFEAAKEMAHLAREENEALKARLATLEAKLDSAVAAAASTPPPAPSSPEVAPGGF